MEKDENGFLSDILGELYTEKAPEENKEKDQAPEADNPQKDGEVTETEMSDADLALSVSVDLPAEAAEYDEQPEAKPEAAPAKKQKTAEEIQAIRQRAEADVKSLRETFPELKRIKSLAELSDPQKYLSYRDKGLTAEEAYTLTYAGQRRQNPGARRPGVPSAPSGGGPGYNGLTAKELSEARAQTGLDDETLKKYYRKF